MAATSQDPYSSRQPFGSASSAVKDDVDALRSDIANLATSVKQLASEKVGTASADAQEMAKEKLGDIESAIRSNPTQSALIAIGVGFLIGLVMTR